MPEPGTITRVLNGALKTSDGPEQAAAVQRQLYREMRRIAFDQLRGRTPTGVDQLDLGATVLVHEAWLKLARTGQWDNRAHFFGSAARAMRQVLSREGRKHRSARDRNTAVARTRPEWSPDGEALLDRALRVDRAIDRLEGEDPQLSQIAVMRLYADMPIRMIAEELGLSDRTVQRRWKYAAVRLRSLVDQDATRQ